MHFGCVELVEQHSSKARLDSLDALNVPCYAETWHDNPSGIWASQVTNCTIFWLFCNFRSIYLLYRNCSVAGTDTRTAVIWHNVSNRCSDRACHKWICSGTNWSVDRVRSNIIWILSSSSYHYNHVFLLNNKCEWTVAVNTMLNRNYKAKAHTVTLMIIVNVS